jgi:hypothetical protein
MTYTVRTQTIYTFDNYDEAREYQRATPDSHLSSPRFMVYEVIVDTTPKPQSDETPERQYDATRDQRWDNQNETRTFDEIGDTY